MISRDRLRSRDRLLLFLYQTRSHVAAMRSKPGGTHRAGGLPAEVRRFTVAAAAAGLIHDDSLDTLETTQRVQQLRDAHTHASWTHGASAMAPRIIRNEDGSIRKISGWLRKEGAVVTAAAQERWFVGKRHAQTLKYAAREKGSLLGTVNLQKIDAVLAVELKESVGDLAQNTVDGLRHKLRAGISTTLAKLPGAKAQRSKRGSLETHRTFGVGVVGSLQTEFPFKMTPSLKKRNLVAGRDAKEVLERLKQGGALRTWRLTAASASARSLWVEFLSSEVADAHESAERMAIVRAGGTAEDPNHATPQLRMRLELRQAEISSSRRISKALPPSSPKARSPRRSGESLVPNKEVRKAERKAERNAKLKAAAVAARSPREASPREAAPVVVVDEAAAGQQRPTTLATDDLPPPLWNGDAEEPPPVASTLQPRQRAAIAVRVEASGRMGVAFTIDPSSCMAVLKGDPNPEGSIARENPLILRAGDRLDALNGAPFANISAFDSDGDGKIDLAELGEAVRAANLREVYAARPGAASVEGLSDTDVAALILGEFDTDESGELDGDEVSEFLQMVLDSVISKIAAAPRPLVLSFSRPLEELRVLPVALDTSPPPPSWEDDDEAEAEVAVRNAPHLPLPEQQGRDVTGDFLQVFGEGQKY